ncbi:MAG: DeoR family transcriptional regulator [Acetatifactor sp.]|nr:DeoR family transcriptional regulator [Acetatifactor sp.]
MEELLKLLKDGHARTTVQLAVELKTSSEDVRRKLEYLEMVGVIRRISMTGSSCKGCSGCSGEGRGAGKGSCSGCMPDADILNMGDMWEVIER